MQKFILSLFIVCCCQLCIAQPGALDLSFNPGAGSDEEIHTVSVQSDGKIIIGGHFNSYDGYPVTRVARLHPDGSLDTSFHARVNSVVWASAIQADGKIIIAGRFLWYNSSIPVKRIARLHPDGSLDTTFNVGSGFDNYVYTLAIQSDEKILVGGNFTTFNGVTAPYLVRLNPDGSKDTTFNTGTGPNYTVEDIAIQPDGKILICGDFTLYQNAGAWRIARVNPDGSRDASFSSIFGASSVMYSVAAQDDGKIMIGGSFNTYKTILTNRIGRLHPDGDRDSNFDPELGANADVKDIKILDDYADSLPRYLIIGDFTSYHLAPVNRVALLKSNGKIDTTLFNPGMGADSILFVMEQQPDGKMLIAGNMANYDGVARRGIARIYLCETTQPGAISGDDSIKCSGDTLVYSVPQSADVDSYEWTLPAGWTGSSDSASITAISNGQGGVISARAFSDSCGYSEPQTKTIYRILPPEVPICLVTVDTASTHNILLWEKPANKSFIDSFFMYRETTTNVYTKIGAVHRDSLSAFHDYAADPNVTSYRYKMSVIDTCGAESALSDFHNTIHLQNLGNGNFQWTFYDIENESNPVTEFNIYRDNLGNGNFTQIGLVPGTNATFTDVNYSSFQNSIYVVDVNWSRSCTPQRGPVNTTRSNIRRVNRIDTLPQPPDTTGVGIQSLLQKKFLVYPNPAEDMLTLEFLVPARIQRIQLFNTLCQMLFDEQQIQLNATNQQTISVSALPKGIYMLVVETDSGLLKRKVVIQ